MFRRNPEGLYLSPLLLNERWLEHGFASRHAIDWPGEYVRVRQVHSGIVVLSEEAGSTGQELPQADAIVAREHSKWIGVRTADCVPILLADPVNHSVGVVHAGWRGTVANIASVAVNRMQREFGARPEELVAAIGPAIGRCCFEVGPEVEEHFTVWFPEAVSLRYVDLIETNRRQLLGAGLSEARIDVAGLCTRCAPGEFHSFRRDREESGRMVAAIRITSG